jgi:HK97 gp10 family phage protein
MDAGQYVIDTNVFSKAKLLKIRLKEIQREILEATLILIVAEAKKLCPVDTGRLRASLTHELDEILGAMIGKAGTNVEYAAFVELGTKFMSAQPYLYPAFKKGIRYYKKEMKRRVKELTV